MADFCQSPEVVTLHNLIQVSDAEMERNTTRIIESLPDMQAGSLAVAIPVRLGDFGQPAMRRILHLLQMGDLVNRVVLVLNGASAEDHLRIVSNSTLNPGRFDILWAESPNIAELSRLMQARLGKKIGSGKGSACWLAAGYAAVCPDIRVLAFQDADVESYTTAMIARLCRPLLDPRNGMDFAKAYYARVGDRMYGRVTRQFLFPFLEAAQKVFPESRFMRLLRSLRYPLSGEVALSAHLLREMPFHTGWSLELGMLWSICLHNWTVRSCQVEVADDYRHRHHPVDCADTGRQSLSKMAAGLAVSLFSMLEHEGYPLTRWHHNAFLTSFEQCAQTLHRAYRLDATHNDLGWDDGLESSAQSTFLNSVKCAMTSAHEVSAADAVMPAWKWVLEEVPEAEALLRAATKVPHWSKGRTNNSEAMVS